MQQRRPSDPHPPTGAEEVPEGAPEGAPDRVPGADPGGRRWPGLDLLRALAIVLVMASHWMNNLPYFFGRPSPAYGPYAGVVGVGLFFALSGFLIGQILLRIAAAGPTPGDFGRFIARRWLRTLPLYYVMVALLILVFPPSYDVLRTALRAATLTQNFCQPMPPEYWFAVSWSLTIEEWFYLGFGALFLGLAGRLGSGRAMAVSLLAFLLTPLALRAAQPDFFDLARGLDNEVIYRIDAIAFGVAAAWAWQRRAPLFTRPWLAMSAGVLGACVVLWSWFWPSPLSARWYAVFIHDIYMAGCALLLPAALRMPALPRPLAAPIGWLAARSYALYLFHYTVMVDFAQQRLLGPRLIGPVTATLISVIGPFIAAEVSWRLLEHPVLRRRPDQTYGGRPRNRTDHAAPARAIAASTAPATPAP